MSAKKPQIPPKPIRWFAPDEKAEKRLIALGAPKGHIYRGWKGELPGKFKMRDGEYLGVVDGLRAFGRTKRPCVAAVKLIHSWGATVLDCETGQDSCRNGVEMLDDVLKPPQLSPEYQARVNEERKEAWRAKHKIMPKHQAYAIWRHATMSVDEKLDLMHGWTRQTAYNEFGKTGTPAGRRPKARE